jgi:hypothetical protein
MYFMIVYKIYSSPHISDKWPERKNDKQLQFIIERNYKIFHNKLYKKEWIYEEKNKILWKAIKLSSNSLCSWMGKHRHINTI